MKKLIAFALFQLEDDMSHEAFRELIAKWTKEADTLAGRGHFGERAICKRDCANLATSGEPTRESSAPDLLQSLVELAKSAYAAGAASGAQPAIMISASLLERLVMKNCDWKEIARVLNLNETAPATTLSEEQVERIVRLHHDENALPALRAYAKSCKTTRPQLYKELQTMIQLASGPREHKCAFGWTVPKRRRNHERRTIARVD